MSFPRCHLGAQAESIWVLGWPSLLSDSYSISSWLGPLCMLCSEITPPSRSGTVAIWGPAARIDLIPVSLQPAESLWSPNCDHMSPSSLTFKPSLGGGEPLSVPWIWWGHIESSSSHPRHHLVTKSQPFHLLRIVFFFSIHQLCSYSAIPSLVQAPSSHLISSHPHLISGWWNSLSIHLPTTSFATLQAVEAWRAAVHGVAKSDTT